MINEFMTAKGYSKNLIDFKDANLYNIVSPPGAS